MAGLIRNVQFLLHGSKHFGKEGYARAAKQFDQSVMERSLTGKVCVVTGANQGLGLQTSQELAARGATLLMVCRNADRGQQAVDGVRTKTGNPNVHLKVCDVSSIQSIRTLVDDLKASYPSINVLINNAGVMIHDRQKSPEGLDINFATNTLGCFALTLWLEDLLVQGAPSKVIFVSSGGMLTQKLDVDDMQNERMGRSYDGTVAYAKDKRRQVAIAEKFSELWANKGIVAVSCHPGWTETEGVKKSIPGFHSFYKDKFRALPEGADTMVYLALEDNEKLTPGAFYGDRHVQAKHLSMGFTGYTPKQVDELWAKLLELLKH